MVEGKSGLNIQGRDALAQMIREVQNGQVNFSNILVYDVSRWGRFQDADESAYYEYLCRKAGVAVHYCAEQFENDGSPVSTIVKGVKRAMAGGYNGHQISGKLDVSETTVKGLMILQKAREERLLEAAIIGRIPLWVAIDIAKTDTVETQRELLRAYENKQLDYLSIRTVKRLIERRRLIGRQRDGRGLAPKGKTSAESMVSAYRKESQRQKLMVKKAKICDARLSFIVTAFNKLLADEHFVTLLRAESLATMPKYLWAKLAPEHKEAA